MGSEMGLGPRGARRTLATGRGCSEQAEAAALGPARTDPRWGVAASGLRRESLGSLGVMLATAAGVAVVRV